MVSSGSVAVSSWAVPARRNDFLGFHQVAQPVGQTGRHVWRLGQSHRTDTDTVVRPTSDARGLNLAPGQQRLGTESADRKSPSRASVQSAASRAAPPRKHTSSTIDFATIKCSNVLPLAHVLKQPLLVLLLWIHFRWAPSGYLHVEKDTSGSDLSCLGQL
jgi:hypothetical protein